MPKKFVLITITLLVLFTSFAQDKQAKKYAKTITQQDLKAHLSVLAADSLEGRETGMPGQKKAAKYIADHFSKLGLEAPVDGSYLQTFDLKRAMYNEVYLERDDEVKRNFVDFIYYSKNETYGEEIINVVFAGYAELSTIDNINVEGKYVAFVNKEWSDYRNILSKLKESEAKGFFMIIEEPSQFQFIMSRYGNYLSGSKMAFEFDQSGSKIAIIGSEMTEWIFGQSLKDLLENSVGETAELTINADMHIREVTSENVLGFLKGSEKPDEVLVISAHYDHEGIKKGEIYNGADDDGSGTSLVLELAEAFSMAAKKGIKPKRSILFITVSGEEKGLLGSKYYVDNPVFPLANTVTNLNVDMVGRVDDKHTKAPEYVYLIGSDKLSKELHQLSEKMNKTYTNLELDYTFNSDDDPNRYYYRSDHYNFAKNDIPVIFYFNGSHEDYHKPSDTVEKIRFDVLEKRAQLIFHTAWELANRENRVKLD